MGKGSNYERETCKLLSEWWTKGIEGKSRQDVFWRSSQSGGRATQRAKFGKTTFGSYGDIAAVDPIGQPLIKMFTIELKRGRSHGCLSDILDCRKTKKLKPFEQALQQAIRSHEQAGSMAWMLISRRDGRESFVFVQWSALRVLAGDVCIFRERVQVSLFVGGKQRFFCGVRLSDFLKLIRPAAVLRVVETSR